MEFPQTSTKPIEQLCEEAFRGCLIRKFVAKLKFRSSFLCAQMEYSNLIIHWLSEDIAIRVANKFHPILMKQYSTELVA